MAGGYTGEMKQFSLLFRKVVFVVSALCAFEPGAALALEPRTWVIIDGRTVEAELKKVSGDQVILLDGQSRQVVLTKSMLSFGDLDYIKENSPEEKASGFAARATAKPALPNPAKQARIDPKTFVKVEGTFSIEAGEPFLVMETPHFKVMYIKPAEPGDVAELAERLWIDTAFFHSSFGQKFRQRKMAIFLCPNDDSYRYVGEWYGGLMRQANQQDAAAQIAATWPQSAAGTVRIPREIADKHSVLEEGRVFRAYKQTTPPQPRPELVRGVWIPFRTHCLAADLLRAQAGYVQSFGAKGYYAITTGHGFYKEILLTGKSETSLLSATASSGGVGGVTSAGGFKDARNWATELKRQIRKGDITANLDNLFNQTQQSADEKVNVLAYSFARYLQHSPEYLSRFNALIERIDTSGQMPEADQIAKIYNLADAKALEADWIKYVTGPDFR
jgi:hypothetical protein